jgi:hypothetical protein
MGKHYCRYGGLFIQVEGGSAHAQERPASESRRQRRNTSNTFACASIERNAHHKAEVRMGEVDVADPTDPICLRPVSGFPYPPWLSMT